MANNISPLASIDPSVKLGDNVTVYPFAYIEKDVEIGDNCTIMPHVSIHAGCKIGNDNLICENAVIGATPQSFRYCKGNCTLVRIGSGNQIRENVVIAGGLDEHAATIIGNNNFLMEGVHICHDTIIGNDCVLGIGAQVAGECQLSNHCILSSGVIVQHLVRIGQNSLVQSSCCVQKDVPPYVILGGSPASYHGVNATILQKQGITERITRHISNAYRIIYSGNESLDDAVLKIEQQIPMSEEIRHIAAFIRSTERGIVRSEKR